MVMVVDYLPLKLQKLKANIILMILFAFMWLGKGK